MEDSTANRAECIYAQGWLNRLATSPEQGQDLASHWPTQQILLPLLSDVLVQQGGQLQGLVLKQGVGLGREVGEASNKLPCTRGRLGAWSS